MSFVSRRKEIPRIKARPYRSNSVTPAVPATQFKTRRLSNDYASWFQMKFVPFPSFATNAIHTGNEPDQWGTEDLTPHIACSTAFRQSEPGVFKKFDYSRCGNPTRDALERSLAATEDAQYAVTFSSGTAALASIIHLLKSGDEIIAGLDLYGGTGTYFDSVASANGITTFYVDMLDLGEVTKVLTLKTKLVWIESPSNPVMRIVDIQELVKIVKKYSQDIIIAADNTFTTSYFLRPLDLGVDISHQSCTKYLCGHTDVVMGAVAVNEEKLYDRLRFYQINLGAIPSPFDCFLAIRSLKTMPVRMREHMRNGLIIANFLNMHPCIEKVNHPGLRSHPQYELFREQSRGYSSVLSFYVKGDKADLWVFFKSLKIFTLAASLGGCESIVSFPSVMTHDGLPPEVLLRAGITENLARLSVGLEDVEDLIADLDQALWASCGENLMKNGHKENGDSGDHETSEDE